MRGPRSLRNRLALLALGVTALWVVVLTAAFNLLLVHQLDSQADDLLRARAEAAASTVEVQPGGTLRVRDAQGDTFTDAGTWVYQGTRAVERARASPALQQVADSLAGGAAGFVRQPEPDDVRFYAQPILSGGRQVGTVVASVSLDPYQRTEELTALASGGLAVLLLAALWLSTRASVARALRPVTAMTAQAAHWGASDVGRRFGAATRPRELDVLAATLDALLDRLSAVLRHEQVLSAEISHELRTPLSRIIAEADLLRSRDRSRTELEQAHAAIASDAEQMRSLLETLLSTARTTGASPGQCDVEQAVTEAVRQWAGPRGGAGPPIQVSTGRSVPGRAGVEGAVLARVLGPLLDNASRYARQRVQVILERAPTGPVVTVRDDGPGLPPGDEEKVFEPGHRGDPADAHDGAGLGLALARRLARAGGGDLTASSGTTGASFTVTLPPG